MIGLAWATGWRLGLFAPLVLVLLRSRLCSGSILALYYLLENRFEKVFLLLRGLFNFSLQWAVNYQQIPLARLNRVTFFVHI